jgi:hypothetical protein
MNLDECVARRPSEQAELFILCTMVKGSCLFLIRTRLGFREKMLGVKESALQPHRSLVSPSDHAAIGTEDAGGGVIRLCKWSLPCEQEEGESFFEHCSQLP